MRVRAYCAVARVCVCVRARGSMEADVVGAPVRTLRELVRAAQGGDDEAFNEYVHRILKNAIVIVNSIATVLVRSTAIPRVQRQAATIARRLDGQIPVRIFAPVHIRYNDLAVQVFACGTQFMDDGQVTRCVVTAAQNKYTATTVALGVMRRLMQELVRANGGGPPVLFEVIDVRMDNDVASVNTGMPIDRDALIAANKTNANVMPHGDFPAVFVKHTIERVNGAAFTLQFNVFQTGRCMFLGRRSETDTPAAVWHALRFLLPFLRSDATAILQPGLDRAKSGGAATATRRAKASASAQATSPSKRGRNAPLDADGGI